MGNRCDMPEHLLFDILLWLPVTSLLRFKAVCKSWYALIDSPTFISKHFGHNSGNVNLLGVCFNIANNEGFKFCLLSGNKYEVYNDFDCGLPMHVIDDKHRAFSSNGIICFVLQSGNISLWNPALKQLKSLLAPHQNGHFPFFGFGFNGKSNDYNIVRTSFCMENTSITIVEIYSLRANSWRTMHKDFVVPFRFFVSITYDITKDGTCFWIGYAEGVGQDPAGNVILSFDLNEETYKTMPLPVEEVPISAVIDFLGDKLAYIHGVDRCSLGHLYYEIWVLHEYGVKESWNKAWKIGPTGTLETNSVLYPLSFTSNGEFLLLSRNGWVKKTGSFCLYDLSSKENEYFELGQPILIFLWSISYTESLFPVKRANDTQ